MQDERSMVLVRNLLEVFNERDEAKRLEVIQELYTEKATFFEMDASFTGFQEINRRVTEVLASLPPEGLFQTQGPMTRNHQAARLSWILATDQGAVLATGMDVALLEGDRIEALYIFIDPPPAQAS